MHPFNFFYLSEAAVTSPLADFIDAGEAVEIVKEGKPVAVLIPIEDYEVLRGMLADLQQIASGTDVD